MLVCPQPCLSFLEPEPEGLDARRILCPLHFGCRKVPTCSNDPAKPSEALQKASKIHLPVRAHAAHNGAVHFRAAVRAGTPHT